MKEKKTEFSFGTINEPSAVRMKEINSKFQISISRLNISVFIHLNSPKMPEFGDNPLVNFVFNCDCVFGVPYV